MSDYLPVAIFNLAQSPLSRFWIQIGPLMLASAMFAAPALAQRQLPLNGKPIVVDFGMQPLYYGSVDVGDYDADGDVDVLLSGRSGSHMMTRVYCQGDIAFQYFLAGSDQPRVDTMKTFLATTTNLPSLWQSDVKWGDFDGDRDLDVLISGLNSIDDVPTLGAVTRLFEYRGGVFIEVQQNTFPGAYAGENAWGDYDGDGDLDLIITGATSPRHPFSPITALFRNEGGHFARVDSNLPAAAFGAVAWSDVDGDGDLDLALQGEQGSGRLVTDVYLNHGNGSFAAMGLGIDPLAFGSFDWADVDQDGDSDLLVTGGRYDPYLLRGVTEIYINEGDRFSQMETSIGGAVFGAAVWTDYDLDGRIDVVLNGAPTLAGQPVFQVYLNSGMSFDEAFTTSGMVFSDIGVGDYNMDLDPDVITVGRTFDEVTVTNFFQNEIVSDALPEEYLNTSVIEELGCRSQ